MLQKNCVAKVTMTSALDSCPSALALAGLLNHEIEFPLGLLGFPDCRRFMLKRFASGDANESPFFILDSLDQELSFPVIHPDFVSPDYTVPIFPQLLDSLGAKAGAELVPLLIVTVRERVEDTTVNLQGPLLISAQSHTGVQLVVEEFPLRHPLVNGPSR
jgi:flagellar assembly factor FliW